MIASEPSAASRSERIWPPPPEEEEPPLFMKEEGGRLLVGTAVLEL